MKRLWMLVLASCTTTREAPLPRETHPTRPWILVSRDGGLCFRRERPEVRVDVRAPDTARVGEVVEIEAWIVDPEPGAIYILEARPFEVLLVGPSRIEGTRATFRCVRWMEGRGRLVVEGYLP
jgi:hypothetical protein